MSQRELQCLNEILDVSYGDLRELLTCDHPPYNVSGLIIKEQKTIEDIEYLIADLKAEIASKELHRYLMNEYKITQQMKKITI
jgi:hypothetical protein|tara:strand:- start:711 stop:959 length:249 start_codon:yes stop_codon:yes gene_type:complete